MGGLAYVRSGCVRRCLDPTLFPVALHRDLLREVRSLDEFDLRRLNLFIREILSARAGEPSDGGDPGSGPAAARGSYRQQLVRCGKKACTRCPHGPYWYRYWREDGRLRSRYIGKDLPDDAAG